MDWVTALAVMASVSGLTITVVVLASLSALKRNLDDTVVKQAQQIKRLTEAVGALTQQQQQQQTRIQGLTDANRRLTDELIALAERLGDGDGTRPGGTPRQLH